MAVTGRGKTDKKIQTMVIFIVIHKKSRTNAALDDNI
jgi:hypothetical protein